ncbi:hypothetical protein pipiens_002383 [Culex pipiens pipiens]|uniref:Uncharacterized protein n=1 Tax=Culex pipiens pipiens TaxID=38569 RepID=A0ABD1DGN6_CULPP
MDYSDNIEWTEDTEAVGASKPKKGRFESKAYTLEEAKDLQNQPDPVQPILITEIKEGDSGSSFISSQSSAVPPEGSVPVIIQAGGQIVRLEDGSIAQIISNGGDSAECQLTNTPCCDKKTEIRRFGPKIPAVEKMVSGQPEHESSSDDEDFPGIETNME